MRAFQISALIETAVRDERERGIIRSKALEDAARQALNALSCIEYGMCGITDGPSDDTTEAAMDALRAALAEPVQEPVAWMVYTLDGKSVCVTDNPADFIEWRSLPLYTAPPQRKPLRTVIYACPICAASLERQE